ncbi:NUDIX domain-containing protein [Salsipaludibacter albus]|uniref:NUDIX domain-containing protein n=1 Tax=Salsipaludibacter albus TaxID=2849650 RepID=UPI001EE4CFDD
MSGDDTPTGDAAPWEVLDTEVHWSGYSTVRTDTIALADGGTAEREVVEHQPAVAVVPLTADGDVVLLRQYRHALRRYVLEVPAGGVDEDDVGPEEAAQRELAEEIGRRAGRLEHLTRFDNSVGWCTEYTDVYVATDLVDAPPHDGFTAEAEEADMEVVVLPLDAAVAAAHDGTITDSKTVIGLLLAAHHRA